jgi:hypothetical protein
MSDLLDELKEDLHEERLQQLWKKYGSWVIGGVLTILGGTALGIAWQSWSTSKQADYAATYVKAMSLESERLDEAVKLLEELSHRSSGFSLLAKFHLASKALKSGDVAQAQAHLRAVEDMGHLDPIYRDLAKLMGLYMTLDEADSEKALKEVETLTGEKNPWRYLALELKGLLLMKKKDYALAQATFDNLVALNIPIPAFSHRVKALAGWAKSANTKAAPQSTPATPAS